MVEPRKLFGGLGNRLFQMAYIYNQVAKREIPDIYVQDEKYFELVKDYFKELIRPQGYCPKIGIHVRRTDYIGNDFYVDLTKTDYYQNAMKEFSGEKFIVFSDDIEWCKKQDIFKDCEFSDGSELDDFNKMASCKGLIIANSSFSWWAAYLNTGKIIAPIDWYTDCVETRTVIPKTWKRL